MKKLLLDESKNLEELLIRDDFKIKNVGRNSTIEHYEFGKIEKDVSQNLEVVPYEVEGINTIRFQGKMNLKIGDVISALILPYQQEKSTNFYNFALEISRYSSDGDIEQKSYSDFLFK